ncbi:hypothetical protein [Pseudomonas phage Almagne]|nr:hypothetical protein [Pseudomonas phage Almagne]
MKYSVHSITTHDNGMKLYTISSPGFSTQVCSSQAHPIEALCGELNRLEERVKYFGGSHPKRHKGVTIDGKRYLLESLATEDLSVQVEIKCKALKRVEELEKQVFDGECDNKALTQRLGVRTSQVSRLLYVLERCQGILAAYVQPEPRLKPKVALQDLLDVLDDSALVTMMRNLRELIGVKDNGSVELTKTDKLAILEALDRVAACYPGIWSKELRAVYENACRILGASEDGEETPAYSVKIAPGAVEGKDYFTGFGVGIHEGPHPAFIVQNGQTFIDASKILDGIKGVIGETELGAELQERVVNVTNNHFAPEYRLRRKERAALESAIKKLEEKAGGIGLTAEEEAAQSLRKLLKKLS